ncbi:MAG: InlB B-repeat-containing protein [Acutalibacteraceae bacterium]
MEVDYVPKFSPNYVTITVPKNAEVPITKVSGNKGYATYNGYSGWIDLNYCQYVAPVITKPAAPSLTLVTSKDVDINGSITVNWAPVIDAKYYTVGLYNSSGQVVKSYSDIYGNSASFCVSEPGTYSVRATAHNNLFASDQSTLPQLITVHGDSTVTFLNDDGTVIGTQKVGFGGNATAPIAPYKKGYSFQGWSGSISNIKSDTTVTATYIANEYKVQFIDYNGDVIGSTQTVKYGENAIAPEASSVPVKPGYEFVGWDSELYKNVYAEATSNIIKINAIYNWINRDLPISCNVVSAQRQTDSYKIVFDITNNIDKPVRGRAIVCLKTAGGKLIDTTESAAFSLSAGETLESYRVFVPSSKAATTAEIIIVDGYSTGVPISEKTVVTNIDQAKMWSDWSTEYPVGHEDDVIESRVEYRYRDISQKTASTKSIGSDWTLVKTTPTALGWSAWSDSRVTGFNYDDRTRQVETRTVDVYSSRTLYNYFHYYNPSTGRWSPVQYSGFTGYHTKQTTSQLSYKGASSVSGWYYYGSDPCSVCGAQNMWYPNGTSTETYVSGSKTQYRYQDTTYTYTFTKWEDDKWSDWSTNSVSAIDGERQVEERTVYRYKSTNAGIEDDSGTAVPYSWYAGTEYAGKNITVFIMKYDAASDFTNEYVEQTVIDEDGYCNFTYKLREEPTEKTGDFTISVGIEGQTGLIQIGTIEAPDPVYTVKYYNADGQVISEQQITEGQNAVAPEEYPEKPGSIFAGWNNTGSNVRSDLDIRPIYVEEVYTVTYIDWRAETYETMEYKYGEPLITPTIEDCESGTAIGWDTEAVAEDENGNKIVTCDMVITALYETRAYKVVYYDAYGNIINEQAVEYDGAVVEPELPEDEDVSYIDWEYDKEELLSVKHDIAVFPSYVFNETTAQPTASLETGSYSGSQTVELTCEDENAVIYYTLDGSDPQENPDVLIYEEPITVNDTTTIIYYASSLGKNDSNYAINHYVIDGNGTLVNVIDKLDEKRNTSFIVDDISSYDDSEFDCIDGYTYKGMYYDETYRSKVNFATDAFGDVVNLYVRYTAKTYTVTFYDLYGDIVSAQVAKYGDSVTPPEMENDGNLIFTGWDSDDYGFVYDNLEINPIYKEESEIVNITLDKTVYSLDEGAMFKLNATVTPNDKKDTEVLWYSNDYSIAEIGDDGMVTGIAPGQTTVYATTENGDAYAECVVTVCESPNISICLKELSVLGLDSMGYLRELKVDSNTVSFVKTQLRNTENELIFTDINEIVLSDDELAGTGTVISLIKNDKTVDTMTIVMTGDVNGDGMINNKDVVITAQTILEIIENPLECQLIAMDTNGDGKVNTRDASILSRYLVGKVTF